ncbi:iron complex outermembrane recepter protein [Cupriavidus sp. YR651]|uniref:TonB-dependent siderophore receptor n=1 Tax=Cupriavidus sp. YR651 TaxID=1855315 RepID=UPI0008858EE4|nr:TonB-dependent receptor [Cupriavidus sp. YR651]SDC70970.1 iron complex outermembrane recepter protein [Cupriavidus sp. YR651]
MPSQPQAPARHRSRFILKHAVLLACLQGAGLLSGASFAQTAAQSTAPSSATQTAGPTRAYDIPAGPLQATLNRFGREAGILLAFTPEQTANRQSAGLRGQYSVSAGLAAILHGSELAAAPQADGSFILVRQRTTQADAPPAPGDGVAALPLVTVSATAESYRPPPVTNVLRSDLPLLDTPQAVNILPAQALRDQRPRNLDDAVNNISGITQGNTLAGTQDTLMKRGFGGNRDGSIMHNGMPLVQGRGMNAAADSVEVLKGPASLLYGIMDPGGVINIVSKRPSLQQYNAISVLGTTYGHGKNGAGGTIDTTGPIGTSGLAYRLVADYVDEQYWRNFGVHRETLVAPSLAWYGRDTQVVLSYEYRKFLYPFDRGTALDPRTNEPLPIPSRRRLDEPFNEMDGESHLAQLAVDHQFNADWKGHFGYSYNREVYDAGQLRVTGVNTTTGVLTRSNDATHGSLSTDSYGVAYVDGNFQVAGMRNNLQIGMDSEYRRFYRADLLRQATTSRFNYQNPVYGLESPSSTVSASDSDQTDALHSTSVFLQDSLYLTDKWILVGGARYMTWSQVAGRGRPFTANTDISGNKWLPRAGIVYKWTPAVSVYGSYTESLKPTSTIAPLASGVVIDSSVAPEEAKSWELGTKVDFAGGLTGTLALFNIDKKNVLVSQYNDVTKLTDWRTSGRARSRGVELDVAGQIGNHWNVIASYAYIDAKTTEDPLYAGNRLWNVAQHTASLFATYDFGQIFGGDRFRLGGGAHYVGNRPGDSANSFTLPAYTVFDAFATYETRVGAQKVRFQLNVKNLFNRVYYPSSANRYFVAVGDARQVSLLTTFEF